MIVYTNFSNFPQKTRKQKIINAILYIVFGLLFMFLSNFIVNSFALMIGITLILFAAYNLFFGVTYKQGTSLITSIFLLLFGIIAIVAKDGVIEVIKIMLSLSAILMGIKRIFYSFLLKDYTKYWFINTIVGTVIAILGILMFAGKFELNIIVIILGAIFTIYGSAKLISALNSKEQEYSNNEMKDIYSRYNKKIHSDDVIDVEVEEKNDHENDR